MELTEIVATFNFNQICRLCMGQDLNLLPLFVKQSSLSEKVLALFPVLKLSSSDGLPGQICSQCVNQVNTSYSFKLQCETSDLTLRRLLDFRHGGQFSGENCSSGAIKVEAVIKEDVAIEDDTLGFDSVGEQE
ncbi:hypothetical protein C0J52_09705 [Blattella germanica]|nr:hypothetical protein C0J52_09705 [Blattella germanica]